MRLNAWSRQAREVLVAYQEAHSRLLFDTTVGAPADASPLAAVRAGLRALSAAFPADRRQHVARVWTAINGHSDLRERAAFKRAGYLDALRAALQERDVTDTTAAVAAELGVLAFTTAMTEWAADESATDLGELADPRLLQTAAAAAALGGTSDRKVSAATRVPTSKVAAATSSPPERPTTTHNHLNRRRHEHPPQ